MSVRPKKPNPYQDQYRCWTPYVSPYQCCPPIRIKEYVCPPNLFLGYQPPNLPQYPPEEALRVGTLWPIFYSPYPRCARKEGEQNGTP
ncbi:spore coat associated protein CotJA [Mechercharimyces sp. CAU 1602]|uniref:spore coat associated protein CotJA n=1 Tax=Mechercharimyces sp. CAU 1602 TaxID=2973933 RepID=UPI002163DE1F|nr:spore coat associated protein CotJA [Mechercharimyces sp. CAU 1602]MCS1350193.1 spore coat associated protein CotJA [Mechercharimyces sp. CAU 1602]